MPVITLMLAIPERILEYLICSNFYLYLY